MYITLRFVAENEMILVAKKDDLHVISLDTPDFADTIIEVGRISYAVAIDFDPVDRRVYWSDTDKHVLERASLDGTGLIYRILLLQFINLMDDFQIRMKCKNYFF